MPNTTVVAVVATKGGVGKTTLAANLSGLLADLGQRVLAIDADMQPSLSKYFTLASTPTAGLAQVIARGGIIQAGDITPTTIDGLDVVLSNISDATQSWLKEREDRLIMLKRAVRQPIIRDTYDFVVIDTQGAKGELQRSAAMAADLLVTPLCPRMMEVAEFHTGTLDMLSSLNAMSDFSAELRAAPLAVVINQLDRTRAARLLMEEVRKEFRSHPYIRLLDTVIPSAKAYPDARLERQPVHRFDEPRVDRVQKSGYEVMHELVFELAPHLKGMWSKDEPPGRTADHVEASETSS
ncbi:MAG: ParA family protein [Burkholderiaceae bacterium]|nr:ParA family protein [Burkholderiaceae bacterium]